MSPATPNDRRDPRIKDIWLTDFYLPGRHRLRLGAIILTALLVPLAAMGMARHTGHWDWFERSGSITETIGLALAAGRQIRLGVLELTKKQAKDGQNDDRIELHVDIINNKAGFALCALGSLIWGWGSYLHEWSFLFLIGWLLAVSHTIRRDFVRVQTG